MRRSAISPSSFIWINSSISDYMKVPGMSHIMTSLPSIVSIKHIMNNASTFMVGELVSSFVLYRHCLGPSAQPRAFTFPQHFSFKNMRYCSAAFCCDDVRLLAFRPTMTFQYYSCSSSCMIDTPPFSPNSFKPAFADIWSVKKLNT